MAAVGSVLSPVKEINWSAESLEKSVVAKSYVYRMTEKGLSYIRLGDSTLPVRVMVLPFEPSGITISGDMLALIGTKTDGMTEIAYVDITTPAAPKLVTHMTAEGTFVATRSANNTLFFILRGQWKENVHVPTLAVGGKEIAYDYKKPTCPCPALYGFSREYRNPNFVHVLTADTRNPAQFTTGQVLALSEDQTVTVTSGALYISYAPQMQEDDVLLDALKNVLVSKLSNAAKVQYTQIVQAPDFLLTPEERRRKQLAFLRRQEQLLSPEMQKAVEKELTSTAEYSTYKEKLRVTTVHKLRFDEGKFQYVTAATTPGLPFASPLLGDTEGGSWMLSQEGSGALLRTFDPQMAPKGTVLLENMASPVVRRNRGNTIWLGNSGTSSVREIQMADLSAPRSTEGPDLTMDARLITLDAGRAIQVQKTAKGLELQLLSLGDMNVQARFALEGTEAYSRIFDSLDAAYYDTATKQLFVHMSEKRGTSQKETFDGLMVFKAEEGRLEKKAEIDLRSGMTGDLGTDIRVMPLGDKEVVVIYGKVASTMNTENLTESARKILE